MKHVYPDQVDEPNLTQLIQEFVYHQHHPSSGACNIPNLPPFYEKIIIHTATVTTFHAPSDLSGIGGMKHERIYAVSCWRNGPGHYNTLFTSAASDNMDKDLSTCGILGLEVACAHLFFSFTLDGIEYPCTLVHWFSHPTDMSNGITGMYTVEPDHLPNGQPMTAVVHLDTVFRAVHLIPVFPNQPALSKHQCHEQMLDQFSEFYVNKYINYHAFEVVR